MEDQRRAGHVSNLMGDRAHQNSCVLQEVFQAHILAVCQLLWEVNDDLCKAIPARAQGGPQISDSSFQWLMASGSSSRDCGWSLELIFFISISYHRLIVVESRPRIFPLLNAK